jgi:hypothetical protein
MDRVVVLQSKAGYWGFVSIVPDIHELARKLDFGQVTQVDAQRRYVKVEFTEAQVEQLGRRP